VRLITVDADCCAISGILNFPNRETSTYVYRIPSEIHGTGSQVVGSYSRRLPKEATYKCVVRELPS